MHSSCFYTVKSSTEVTLTLIFIFFGRIAITSPDFMKAFHFSLVTGFFFILTLSPILIPDQLQRNIFFQRQNPLYILVNWISFRFGLQHLVHFSAGQLSQTHWRCSKSIETEIEKTHSEYYQSWIDLGRPQTSTLLKQYGIILAEIETKLVNPNKSHSSDAPQ